MPSTMMDLRYRRNGILLRAVFGWGDSFVMIFRNARASVLAAVIGVTAPLCTPGYAQDRVALVIGNGKYVNATALPNPPNDARAMAKALRDIGFDLTEGFDLD